MISWIVTAAQLPGYWRFKSALSTPEKTQMKQLRNVLRSAAATKTGKKLGLHSKMSYSEFASAVPFTDYAFWEQDIAEQKQSGDNVICSKVERFQPTSGSTSAQKWIPYTKGFMTEMDAAVQAWLGDVGIRTNKAFRGAQYWSLSWLPQDQRATRPSNDDLELLPAWKRKILEKVMAVPAAVTYTETMEESQFATLAYLCTRSDLSLVSVWSPTFWLTLLNRLEDWRELLSLTLDTGTWQLPGWSSKLKPPIANHRAAAILRTHHGESLIAALWPNLSMVSCWDSAGSQSWADEIRRRHTTNGQQNVFVQGKGLWATEGVITIPFQNQFPAAITSHFLEWMDLDTAEIFPTWKLRKGQMVQPMLSGRHGLLRYKLNDAMQVTGFLNATPTFEFHGRLRETDLVGEKMSPKLTLDAFDFVETSTGVRPMSMLAVRTRGKNPYYMVLAPESHVEVRKLEKAMEESLSKIFHYKLARELGQLDAVKVQKHLNPESVYQDAFVRKGMLTGDIKLEPLAEISEEFLL